MEGRDWKVGLMGRMGETDVRRGLGVPGGRGHVGASGRWVGWVWGRNPVGIEGGGRRMDGVDGMDGVWCKGEGLQAHFVRGGSCNADSRPEPSAAGSEGGLGGHRG